MELFQELVFTISFSLIVSLLIAKLFSLSSSFDDGNSTVSIRVEEKIEKEWVVCDSVKQEKAGGFEDLIEGRDDVAFGRFGDELATRAVIEDTESDSGVGDCFVFDESPERTESNDAAAGLVENDAVDVADSTESLVQEDCAKPIGVQQVPSAIDAGEVKLEEEDENFDDDWQGIETTELEKSFGAAVAFMDSKINIDRLNLIDNEVKIQLYGLHRVAIEGPCFEPQPMALKLSARANWNSWKRSENLGREDAMERYIALVSQHVPGWMGNHSSDRQ